MKKKKYTAPQLTVVRFKIEKGYVNSGSPMTGFLQLYDGEQETQTQESWSDHSTWSSDGNGFF